MLGSGIRMTLSFLSFSFFPFLLLFFFGSSVKAGKIDFECLFWISLV
jgi:hypothetical protein